MAWAKRHLCDNACLLMCMVSQLRSTACGRMKLLRLWVPPLTWPQVHLDGLMELNSEVAK